MLPHPEQLLDGLMLEAVVLKVDVCKEHVVADIAARCQRVEGRVRSRVARQKNGFQLCEGLEEIRGHRGIEQEYLERTRVQK